MLKVVGKHLLAVARTRVCRHSHHKLLVRVLEPCLTDSSPDDSRPRESNLDAITVSIYAVSLSSLIWT